MESSTLFAQVFLLFGRRVGRWFMLLLLLLFPLCTLPSQAKQPKQPKQPKQEKLSTLNKNARMALKNQSGQEAALGALLNALNRPELKNAQRAKIYYTAAQLDESINGIENRKAYLKQAYDTAKFFNKLRDMYNRLQLCDSIDLLPDAKGKVHARLQKKTTALRLKHRRNIFGGGRYYLFKQNYKEAYPFYDLYCIYSREEKQDTLYPQAALCATLSAFLVENWQGTIKYADTAIFYSDTATSAILHEYKVRSYEKMKNDSLWVAMLQQGVVKYPHHDYFFVQLADWCYAHRRYDVERKLADRVIADTGGKAIHYYAKSKSYLAEENYEACIEFADSTIARQKDFADAYYNKGISYINMAVIAHEKSCKDVKNPQYAIDKQRTQELYKKARPCMEMVRRLQPEKSDLWAPLLYRIYLNLNLGDEFNEIDRLLHPKPLP